VTFLQALHSDRVLLMDGALGTELLRAGLKPGACAERWNLTHADRVLAIHCAYTSAGAEVLLTNTFQSHPAHLARFGLEDRLETINRAALHLARRAAGPGRFVLADVGPIVDPITESEFPDRSALARVLASLDGADGFLFETCSSPAALSAVQYAFHRVPEADGVPLLLSLTYLRDPSGALVTRSGHAPETYGRHAERHGVAALGVNCGRDIGMAEVLEIVRRYRRETDLPLFARPNAGTPQRVGEGWVYPHAGEEMAGRVPELVAVGAKMIGGCCGTTPEHIAAFARRPHLGGGVIGHWPTNDE
jgi:5-methyltetrahydrofolate--homocysteine methyltransferase